MSKSLYDDGASFKVGSPPPKGYLAWHAWAEAQSIGGLKQEQCPRCGLFRYPQEPCRKDGACPK